MQQNMIDINEQQIVRWVFGNISSEKQAIEMVEDLLELKIDLVRQAIDLSDEQVVALTLAGQGDLHRFLGEYYMLRHGIKLGPMPQDEWQEVWRQVQPMQKRFQAGIYGHSSLLNKTVRSILNDEQWAEYQQLEADRVRRHYRSIVQATIASLEGKCPLTQDQRQQFIDLVMEQAPAREYNGHRYYQMYYVLYQISKIDEEKLKPIFHEREWPIIERARKQGASMAGSLNLEELDEE
ncbi:MAG: hypothetical protein KDA80_14995 [Planctomycetaceae bacterium]|nr:hypothetical protein [Planctomycetaceae bacterium]